MTQHPDPTAHAAAMPDTFDIVYDRGNWPVIALVALALGVGVTIAAAIILARMGDDHADE